MYSSDWQGGVPTISVERKQNQYNSYLETVKLNIDLIGIDPANIYKIQVLGSFSYELSSLLKIQMLGMIHAEVNTPNGAAKTLISG